MEEKTATGDKCIGLGTLNLKPETLNPKSCQLTRGSASEILGAIGSLMMRVILKMAMGFRKLQMEHGTAPSACGINEGPDPNKSA